MYIRPVKKIVLMRHGKAEVAAPRGRDFDRPLAKRGHQDSILVAAAIAALGDEPDVIVASPALRAKETAEEVARAFIRRGIVWDRALYGAGGDAWLSAVRGIDPRASCVLIVAHSPGVEEAAALLTGAPPGFLACPTAGAIGLAYGGPTWKSVDPGSATLVYLIRPKMLRELRPARKRPS